MRESTYLVMLLLWVANGASALAFGENRPNFLMIIADDLCRRDLGYEGNSDVRTPNLDRLCSESLHLRKMFNPATSCSPTRHALFTGLYPIRSGAFPNHTRVYDGTESLFTILKRAGYRVALQNKSHVGPNATFPYEQIVGQDEFSGASNFITRDSKQPWFLVFGSNDPHEPWDRGLKYDPGNLTVPAYLHDDPVTRDCLARYYGEIGQLDWQVGRLLAILEEAKQSTNTIVVFVSEQGNSMPFGGKWSVYDNGIHCSTLIRWPGRVKAGSKCDALTQYVDVAPTILEAAGVDPRKIDVHCPDARGNLGFDGKSMMPLLLGEQSQFRDYVFAQHTTLGTVGAIGPYPIRAVRNGRYKLIRNLAHENTYTITGLHKGQPIETWKAAAEEDAQLASRIEWLFHRPAEELYDLDADPMEMTNLASDPKLDDLRSLLRQQLEEWMQQQGDKGLQTELLAKTRQGRSPVDKAKASKVNSNN